MQKRDMGVPRRAGIDTETQGVILWKTEVLCSSSVHERETAGRGRVPRVRRNHIQRSLQLCRVLDRFFIPIVVVGDKSLRLFCHDRIPTRAVIWTRIWLLWLVVTRVLR